MKRDLDELKAYDPSAIAAKLGEMDVCEIECFDAGQVGVFCSQAAPRSNA